MIVAEALGVDQRWLDNVIAQADLAGVQRHGRGVGRAISPAAILTLAVGLEISEALGMPMPAALRLASRLSDSGECLAASLITVRVDVGAIGNRMAMRLSEAVEAHPPPRRGRPPRDSTRASVR